jgi:hypothetical protein
MEQPISISCPWCGEPLDTFFDISVGNQQYVEDCQVCCRPILLSYTVDEMGQVQVNVERE